MAYGPPIAKNRGFTRRDATPERLLRSRPAPEEVYVATTQAISSILVAGLLLTALALAQTTGQASGTGAQSGSSSPAVAGTGDRVHRGAA